jgi:endoribonuclease Nob1
VKFILDTSALFSMERLPEGESFTTPGVIAELNKYGDQRVQYWEDALVVTEPSRPMLMEVKGVAERTGDDARLSPVDLGLLALAKELGGTILTDDYSIQNVAKTMSLEYRPVGLRGIKEVFAWKYRCSGCGRVWEKNYPECPVCGRSLRSTRSRK